MRTQEVELRGKDFPGAYSDVFANKDVALAEGARIKLKPWAYRVFAAGRLPGGSLSDASSVPSKPAAAQTSAEVPVDPGCGGPPTVVPAGSSDLDMLVSWMTGSFTSAEQAAADTDYYDIRLEMVPLWRERIDGRWLYVEQAVAGREDTPYRQRVYRVTMESDGSVRSEVYSFRDPLRFAGDWKKPAPLTALTPDSLEVRTGCAVILRRVSEVLYDGRTVDKQCTSEHRGAAYATSEVRVTPEGITTWDRGYDLEGTQVWGSTGGGYIFKKIKPDEPSPR
jgi:hypothetical protein